MKNFADQLELYRGRIGELRGRVRAGTSPETDLLTSESQQAGLRAQHENALAELGAARESFEFLTGLGVKAELAGVDLTQPAPPPVEELLRTIDRRPDLKDLAERAGGADAAVSVERGAHLPTADLIGNYYFKRISLLEDIRWDVRAEVSLPLYAGGTISSATRQATLERESAELELARARRRAEQQVRTLHVGYVTSLAAIGALEKSLDLSERNYERLKLDYRRGLTRNLDVLQALTASLTARQALVRAYFAAKVRWIELKIASGSET